MLFLQLQPFCVVTIYLTLMLPAGLFSLCVLSFILIFGEYIALNIPYFSRIQIKSIFGILTGKKHPKIKLQHFRKVWIWTFGLLIHQIYSIYEVPKLKQNLQKRNVVTGKTPFFVIGQFCTPHCLNIGFWQSCLVRKCYVVNVSTFN